MNNVKFSIENGIEQLTWHAIFVFHFESDYNCIDIALAKAVSLSFCVSIGKLSQIVKSDR